MSDIDYMNDCIDSYIFEIEELQEKYDLLSKQYNKLLERYQDVLNKAKQSADSFEYCLRDTEQLYEKAINKLKENGLYDAKEFEVEEE